MSLKAINQVIEDAPPHWSPGTRLVAILIADHVNGDGNCWPALSSIASHSGLTVRWVRRIIRQLESEGVLARSERFTGPVDHSRQTSNLYIWTWTPGMEFKPISAPLRLL